MLKRIILAHCLFSALSIYCYEPFGMYLGPLLNLLEDFDFDIPRYIVVPINYRGGCQLRLNMNWAGEDHVDIVGNGTPANPTGPYANLPRYYVKKMRLRNMKIKIVALLNPQDMRLYRPNDEPYFLSQIWSLNCYNGIIEFPGPNERVLRLGGSTHWRPGTCGIEEQLAEICFRDHNIGRLADRGVIFEVRQVPYPRYLWNTNGMRALVATCTDFFVTWLPTRDNPWMINNPGQSSRKIVWHLRAAQRANFDRVVLNGYGLAPIFPQMCGPYEVSWEAYDLGNLIQDEALRTDLIRKTSTRQLPREWYICKSS